MKNKIKDFLFKKRIKILKNKKGFSLLEVMIAVGIIGVISAAGMPVYKGYMKNARRATTQSTLSQLFRIGNLTLTEVDASTGFTLTQINSKMKGEMKATDVQYKDENTWCIDIVPTNGAPKGCVDSENVIKLYGGGFVAGDLKKKTDCEMFGGTWTAGNATPCATLGDNSNCLATGSKGTCGAP